MFFFCDGGGGGFFDESARFMLSRLCSDPWEGGVQGVRGGGCTLLLYH